MEVGAWAAVSSCRVGGRRGEFPTPEEVARLRAPVDALFDRDRLRVPTVRSAANAALVEFLACDPTVPLPRIERVARALLEGPPFDGHYDAKAAVLLAESGGDLALALAKRGAILQEDWSEGVELALTASELEESRRAAEALASDALGFVHLRAGRLELAREALDRALELIPGQPTVALHAAELAQAMDDSRRAERILAAAATGDDVDARRCKARLERMVRARGGKARDVTRLVARLERQRRREVIDQALAARQHPPLDIPPLDLTLRGGGRITTDALTLVVVTEPWCTGCRIEVPALAEIHARFRARNDVRFLVVTADPEGVAAMYAEAGLELPIAADDGWVSEVGINSYPTHLFLDRHGRVAFRDRGGGQDPSSTIPARLEALLRERPPTAE